MRILTALPRLILKIVFLIPVLIFRFIGMTVRLIMVVLPVSLAGLVIFKFLPLLPRLFSGHKRETRIELGKILFPHPAVQDTVD